MRVLVLSDIHANRTALEAVLFSAGQVDAVWCLGDLVGYGPDPNECVEMVRKQPNLVCLLGNHDAAVIGQLDQSAFNREANASVNWTKEILLPENAAFLDGLPSRIELERVTLSHGSPRNPIWEYLLDLNTVQMNFSYFRTPFCFVGHTHIPIQYCTNGNGHVDWSVPQQDQVIFPKPQAILNPGSVGQPRDRDPRAAYAIFDTVVESWQSFRVGYDIEQVQQRIFDAGLPRRHGLRLVEGW